MSRLKARQGLALVTADPVRVVDADMVDVPADGETMGEVVMRGNNVMKGYFDDAAATAEAFRGGWFHSGDLGVMHPDGYVELRDRAKDIIISGGENISTIEVERALVRHPDVLEAAVVAIPDEKWGERPKAFVTLRAGATVTEAELIAFSRETLAGIQGAGCGRVRRAPEDVDRQDQEVRAARAGALGARRRVEQHGRNRACGARRARVAVHPGADMRAVVEQHQLIGEALRVGGSGIG